MATMNCKGCGVAVPQQATGRPRQWCGEACRSRTRRKAKAKAKPAPRQPKAVDVVREADRLRKRQGARDKHTLAKQALADWQQANPAADIEDWCQRWFRTPYVAQWAAPKFIRDFMAVAYNAPREVRQLFLHKSAQLGFTSALQGILAYGVVRGSKHIAVAQPTAQDATEFRREAVSPLFDAIEELDLLHATVRSDQSTTGHRVFADSSLRIQGGLRPGRWRRFVADIVAIDERDAMPYSATASADEEGEGDVVTLAMRALQNRNGRLIAGGTPTSAQGPSRIIEEARSAALSLVFVVPCPECGEMTDLQWERLQWPESADSKDAAALDVQHHCGACGAGWPHSKLAKAIEGGRWVESEWLEDAPFATPVAGGAFLDGALRSAAGEALPWPRSIGFAISGLYSVWRPWPELVSLWLQCQSNPAKLQAFVEQQLGRAWQRATESVSQHKLSTKRQRLELVDGLPMDAQTVVLATDVQKDYLVTLVVAWSRPDRGWILERVEHHGGIEKAGEGAWPHWAHWLRERWSDCRLPTYLGIDVGYSQNTVLGSIRALSAQRLLPPLRVYPCKGVELGKPVLRMTSKAPRLALCGADIKRWQLQALASGRIALADTLDDVCLRELAGEAIRPTKRGVAEVVPTGPHEASDCLSYSAALWHGMTGSTLR